MDPYTPPELNASPALTAPAGNAQLALKVPATILLVLTFVSALALPAAIMGQLMQETAENRTFLDSSLDKLERPESEKSEAFRSGEKFGEFAGKAVAFVLWFVSLPIQFLGFWRMRQGRSYQLSIAASVLACIPCFSGCCGIMLPFGIWSLVKLNRPEVKSSFR